MRPYHRLQLLYHTRNFLYEIFYHRWKLLVKKI
uniref:Uncharacterized protein n=1 Tax=Siphoviridae sp. ctL4w2 TaxID=2827844 RepID=A0A8S5SYI0_9CAUD|nr:MAG TPA: hypothetical protein [Siphoviridae sp. ctL4w2]